MKSKTNDRVLSHMEFMREKSPANDSEDSKAVKIVVFDANCLEFIRLRGMFFFLFAFVGCDRFFVSISVTSSSVANASMLSNRATTGASLSATVPG